MKLDYATLISPYPLNLHNVGHVKCPTLKEIWNPDVTYQVYNMYISMLLITPQTYLDNFKDLKNNSPINNNISMIDIIRADKSLQDKFCEIFNFFMVEKVMWDNYTNSYLTYNKLNNEEIIPIGNIHKDIFAELCDVILQRCAINKSKITEKPRFRNKASERAWLKIQKDIKSQEKGNNRNRELPNIISAYAAFNSGVNIINIWDMTVYQLYDQFQRQINNNIYNITSMSVASWGDKDNKFDNEQWFMNFFDE